jgi:hypothetical protein
MAGGARDPAGTAHRSATAGRLPVALAVLLCGASQALAQTDPVSSNAYVCNELTARLAALAKAPPTSAQRWARAIAEQRAAIEQNRAALGRCGGAWDPRCQTIVARGEQMSANLDTLERQYARLGGDRAAGAPERDRLQALSQRLGCGERRPPATATITTTPATADGSSVTIGGTRIAVRRPGEDPGARVRNSSGGFFSMLFGGDERPAPVEDPADGAVDADLADQLSGSFRTLCVRTCDGYFFPISFSAPKGRLATDANVCRTLCPDTEARLYFHRNPGEEAEQAVSADSFEPITRLPNAFRYRTEVVPGCTCGRPDPARLPPAAGGTRGGVPPTARPFDLAAVPLPPPRPAADDDPETQAETIAGFEPQGPIVVTRPEASAPAEDRRLARQDRPPPKVRTVGPKYFVDR